MKTWVGTYINAILPENPTDPYNKEMLSKSLRKEREELQLAYDEGVQKGALKILGLADMYQRIGDELQHIKEALSIYDEWKYSHNNRMNVSLKGRGEVSCHNSGSVAASLQTTLF